MRPSTKTGFEKSLRSMLAGLGLLIFPCALAAQDPQSATESKESSQAQLDFLHALNLAEEGSKPEALRVLAESLRFKPQGNPASALIFDAHTELQTKRGLLLGAHRDAS